MPYRIINRIFPHNPDYVLPISNTWNTVASSSRGVDMTRSLSDNVRRTWILKWTALTPEEMRVIKNFYHAMKGGYNAFLFCPFVGIGGVGNVDVDNYSSITGTVKTGGSGTVIPLENTPDIDDYFNNYLIEIDGTLKLVTDYDGYNKTITPYDTFGSDKAGKTYKLHQFLGNVDGTGTIESNGIVVTGTGTLFLTELQVGDSIVASGQTKIIATIANNLSLTTTVAFSPTISGVGFIRLNYPLIKKYDTYSETKKYIYAQIHDNFGSPPSNQYTPIFWRVVLSSGAIAQYNTISPSEYTFNANYLHTNGVNVKYYEATNGIKLNSAPQTGRIICGSWYHCYLVRFAPDIEVSEEFFNFNLYNLREIQLVQVLEG